MVYAELKMR